jgi:hypothetical protein
MAPVIRIPDELFRRLQTYGKPFVDTPATVIERILNLLEGKEEGATVAREEVGNASLAGHPDLAAERFPNLYLAPASGENLRATIERPVSLASLRGSLSRADTVAIDALLSGSDEFRCWAMTETRRAIYASMRPGDVVVFTEKGSGRFGYRARIVGKLESQQLGELLWPVVPGKPWKLIYFLDDVRRATISKARLLKELGFNPDFWVPGIIRVDSSKLRGAIERSGSIDQLLGIVG